MSSQIETHYGSSSDLAGQIKKRLIAAGKTSEQLTTRDLAPVDEFHIRGRAATLELADRMELTAQSHVLDVGSGLGGPARTLAEDYRCTVTGIDLNPSFTEAATAISSWLGLSDRVRFVHGDATDLPFDVASFDAAMTIHVAMNIRNKDAVFASVKRVLKPGGIFAIYDVLQGEGGPVLFPVPWAREPSISHLVTPVQMRELLRSAGFEIMDEADSTEESERWQRDIAVRAATAGPPPINFGTFLGSDFPQMAHNQVQNLTERRIRTVRYICRA